MSVVAPGSGEASGSCSGAFERKLNIGGAWDGSGFKMGVIPQANVRAIAAAAWFSVGTNSIARASGRRAVAACTATAATMSPSAVLTATATQATPRTNSSLSSA